MESENKIIIVLGVAIVAGVILGVSLAQAVLEDIRTVSKDMKDISLNIKDLTASIKGVDSSVKEVKTSLAERDTITFRREMQANGRRMLSLDYAGKFGRWDVAGTEIDELDRNLQDSANLRPELSQSILGFRSTYVPKLKAAADKRDAKNFEAVWSETYNACVACHQIAAAPQEAFEVLREIGSEVEQLSG